MLKRLYSATAARSMSTPHAGATQLGAGLASRRATSEFRLLSIVSPDKAQER